MKNEFCYHTIVVLIDGCLTTYKIVRDPVLPNVSACENLEGMVSGMGSHYFSTVTGKTTTIVGKETATFDDGLAWVRSFKAHPNVNKLFLANVYCENQEQYKGLYAGTFQIPVGEINTKRYLPKPDEHIIVVPYGVYEAPEMRRYGN